MGGGGGGRRGRACARGAARAPRDPGPGYYPSPAMSAPAPPPGRGNGGANAARQSVTSRPGAGLGGVLGRRSRPSAAGWAVGSGQSPEAPRLLPSGEAAAPVALLGSPGPHAPAQPGSARLGSARLREEGAGQGRARHASGAGSCRALARARHPLPCSRLKIGVFLIPCTRVPQVARSTR